MRVIIAGPRDLAAGPKIITRAILRSGFTPTEIVCGGATGVDCCGRAWAEKKGMDHRVMPARWHEEGRAAGPIRNRRMAEYADALIVVKRPGEYTRGTGSMVREARRAGIPIYVEEVEG